MLEMKDAKCQRLLIKTRLEFINIFLRIFKSQTPRRIIFRLLRFSLHICILSALFFAAISVNTLPQHAVVKSDPQWYSVNIAGSSHVSDGAETIQISSIARRRVRWLKNTMVAEKGFS